MDSGATGGAFGAGKAGLPFDPIEFIKKPQVILRLVSLLFSIIVFGCISNSGWYEGRCMYNSDSGACNYGTGIGVIAFLACIGFLVVDALFDNISSVQHRKYAVIGDLGFSGGWAFLWFVGFCYLTDAWRKTTPESIEGTTRSVSDIQAAIAFSFFSIGTWTALCVLAVLRYRQGSAAAFAPSYEPDMGAQQQQQPYSSYPGTYPAAEQDTYQQPPFNATDRGPQADYQPPTY